MNASNLNNFFFRLINVENPIQLILQTPQIILGKKNLHHQKQRVKNWFFFHFRDIKNLAISPKISKITTLH
jgi:hypothetical protein